MPGLTRRRRASVGAPFNANNYGGGTLKGWWKADSLSLSDGASVSTWTDSSINGNNATAGTAPVFKTGIQNGLPGVLFTRASSQYLLANGIAAVQSGSDLPFTVVLVLQPVSTSGANTYVFAGWGSSAGANPRQWNYSNSTVYDMLKRDDAAAQKTSASAAAQTTVSQVLVFTSTGTTGNTYKDGVKIINGADLDVGTMTVDRFTLGGSIAVATPANFFDGYIFEVIVYAAALSDGDRRAIEAAMARKWGLLVS